MPADDASASAIDEVRRSMSRSSDTKVARTRQAIFEAVESFGEDEPVTVGEVVRRAGISRAAFYTHFAGLEELGLAIMHDMLETIAAQHHDAPLTGYAGWREASTAMLRRNVEHVVRHRGLYLSVFGMPGSSGAFEVAVVDLAGAIAAAFEQMPVLPARLDVAETSRFIAGGTLTMLMHWMRTDPGLPVDEMVTRLISFFPDVEP
ncbi:TetR/AcrR family transcriptional regulator [Herbiconiux sp.]|uniref:TetR/AcrR family transcriptional regulator n=1 Tax=Herbiconiux sp. TaxID=1871186 RepID=UPI0025C62DCA|nr:TetR/AcrR family transcriptional regulator [Herbiconiux sp.]